MDDVIQWMKNHHTEDLEKYLDDDDLFPLVIEIFDILHEFYFEIEDDSE
ncbi:MAG: hypothetical protein ACP5F1_06215 [Thermoplasmata archaeon]|nr:hypothetical protein [Thermoplasmata archaeon]